MSIDRDLSSLVRRALEALGLGAFWDDIKGVFEVSSQFAETSFVRFLFCFVFCFFFFCQKAQVNFNFSKLANKNQIQKILLSNYNFDIGLVILQIQFLLKF